MKWGTNLDYLPNFYIDPITLKVIQDYLYSGFHLVLTGSPGCGKTDFGQKWAKACGIEVHKVNCGAIRNPRDWFGRWEFIEGQGTVFVPSRFIEMVEQSGLIILDEINRTTPENHNPIMNLLDENREVYVEELNRYVRVHEKTLFIATRNAGRQHTGTFFMDHAIEDRFQEIKLHLPPKQEIIRILKQRYPIITEYAEIIARLTIKLNQLYEEETLSRTMGLRPALACAALLTRGNSLETALQYSFVSRYSDQSGMDSERTILLQTIQGLSGIHVYN